MPPDEASTPPAFRGRIGVARRDITPPVGIHARLWGASTHDRSEGTHRPLTATAVALSTSVADTRPLVLVAIDHVELGDMVADPVGAVVNAIPDAGVDGARVMVACSHSHATPWLIQRRIDEPGGHLLEPYVQLLTDAIAHASAEAWRRSEPATLTWGVGRCSLATNRDLVDPEASSRYVVGFNPDIAADDTVLVGRITRDSDGRAIGTLVNYACHPTALGWNNRLASPDYVGTMRDVVEAHTDAPCVFLQGASGELAPAHQYEAGTELADRLGRSLGYAVVSTLEGMLDPGMELAFAGVTESGAALAVWRPRPFDPDSTLAVERIRVELPLKASWPPADATEAPTAWAAERLARKRDIAGPLAGQTVHPTPAWIWRVGSSFLVGHPNEAYSDLQTELRRMFPETSIAVLNLVNAADVVAYLAPAALADRDLYQIWQSPYGPPSLEVLIAECATAITRLSEGPLETSGDTPEGVTEPR